MPILNQIYKNKRNIFILLITLITGFLFAYVINYLPRNRTYRQELDLFIGKKCYHIHHWITLGIILGVFLIGYYNKSIILFYSVVGIMLGLIFEDFLFRDFLKIRNNCKVNKF